MNLSNCYISARAWAVLLAIAITGLALLDPRRVQGASAAALVSNTVTNGTGTNRIETAGLLFEVWTNIPGASVSDLTDNPRYQTNAPDLRALAAAADTRTVFTNDTHELYGGRLSGLLTPKESGTYELFLRSDKASQLFLSPDEDSANLVAIAEEPECCNPFRESGAIQTSAPLPLIADRHYAIQVLWKAETGTNYAQLAWRKAGDPTPAEELSPIPGEFLTTTWDPNVGPPYAAARLSGMSVPLGGTALLSITALGEQPLTYRWSLLGTNLLGATNATLSITNFSLTNVGIYTVVVTNALGALSASAGLFPLGSLFVEAEDFNFDSGRYVTNKPIGMSGVYRGDAYQGLGSELDAGIDYHATGSSNSTFRPSTGAVVGNQNQQADWFPRGEFDVLVSNVVSSNAPGDWFNYTRVFPKPAQDYQVLARIASSGAGGHVEMSQVTSGARTTNQTVVKLGEFDTGRATAGSNQFQFVPLMDVAGHPVVLTNWSGEKTFRVTILTNSAAELDYFVFVPPSSPGATNSFTSVTRDGNNLVLTWTTGRLESAPDVNGPWTPVANATSPITIPMTGERKFYRLR